MRNTSFIAAAALVGLVSTAHAEDFCQQLTPWEGLRQGDKIELQCTTPEGQAYHDVAYAIIVHRVDGSLAVAGREDTPELAQAEHDADAARLGGH